MIISKKDLIANELELGTGTAIVVEDNFTGIRSGVRIWFNDLDDKHGPVAALRPYGLKGHRVVLSFGRFSGDVISQIKKASLEDIQLARALISSIRKEVLVDIFRQDINEWFITDGSFKITATIRNLENPLEDVSVISTCRNVIVPIMAAMAELIGYDVVEDSEVINSTINEGAVTQSLIKRRERNPRNRLLCIRIHGNKCMCCAFEPESFYGDAGSIIEVHHLEPLASIKEPRVYDPFSDLVPLCPNCHRAIHTKRPFPYSIEEIKNIIGV
jgi:5-methylcytosine-specific restriction protein A